LDVDFERPDVLDARLTTVAVQRQRTNDLISVAVGHACY
jgi:hypothetical protein